MARRATTLVARSTTSLSGGAIAGAVIGSVAGVLLLVACVFPFVMRARRRARGQHVGGSSREEMGEAARVSEGVSERGTPEGQGHGYGQETSTIFTSPHHPPSGRSARAFSGPFADPRTTTMAPQTDRQNTNSTMAHPDSAGSKGHQHAPGVTVQQGLTTPITPPPMSLDVFQSAMVKPEEHGQTLKATSAAQAPVSPASSEGQSQAPWNGGGFMSKWSSRDGDSYGAPSRQPTGFSSVPGITEEPEQIPHSATSSQHHHHRFHIPKSVKRILHRRQSSKRSERQFGSSDEISQAQPDGQFVPSQYSPELAIAPQYDTEQPGAAWDYYHPNQPQAVAPLSPMSPSGIVAEPDALSPESDATATPNRVKMRSSSPPVQARKPLPGHDIQRTDTFPLPEIVADLPSPTSVTENAPSGNPMDMMKPSTANEVVWHTKQEIHKMENSPPPNLTPTPVLEQAPIQHTPVEPSPEPSLGQYVNHQPSHQPSYQQNYQQDYQQDYSSAPPNMYIPNAGDFDFNSPNPQLSVHPSPYASTPHSFGQSPASFPSRGTTPITEPQGSMGSVSPNADMMMMDGRIPSQMGNNYTAVEPVSPPTATGFRCPQCPRVFDQVHKLNHHKRYHDKPHPCTHEGCDKSFGTKTHLDRHINDKHNKTKKFYCMEPNCPYSRINGKSFPRKDNWRRHMANKHNLAFEGEPGPEYMDEDMGGT